MSFEQVRPLLLYDGECGFCNRSVQFVLRHDRRGILQFAALQGQTARGLLARHPELQDLDSLVFLEPFRDPHGEQVYVRSDGALKIAAYLGGFWNLCLIANVIPRSVRDSLYDFLAKHRHHLFGKASRCALPSPEVRERFLD